MILGYSLACQGVVIGVEGEVNADVEAAVSVMEAASVSDWVAAVVEKPFVVQALSVAAVVELEEIADKLVAVQMLGLMDAGPVEEEEPQQAEYLEEVASVLLVQMYPKMGERTASQLQHQE